jgi:Mg2+ and Co2+ transporter CorA
MRFLAIFSAFFLPLTLITSFYWMNIKLPFDKNENLIYIFLLFITIIMLVYYIMMKRKWKI